MKRFRVITLGCRTNQYESQAFANQLVKVGYTPAAEEEGADLCIINTCTVTASADKKSLYGIRQQIRENPDARVVVTGCLVERERKTIEAIEGVDVVVGNLEKEELVAQLHPEMENLPEFSIEQFPSHTRAFLKVQDGCNSYCSYCVIPFVRGRSRSKQLGPIIEEAKALISNGYKEIVLTGINIGDFDGGGRLSDLVHAIDALEGLERLRISSIDPDEVDDSLLDAVLNGKTTCHSFHIVLQAGSNVTLKRMRRKYTRQDFITTVERLLAADPDFTLTTDVIVGFPGESEEDFQQTRDLIETLPFAKVHIFPYSKRPMTRAARMEGHLDQETISRRKALLAQDAERAGFRVRERFLGRAVEVLIEDRDPARPGYWTGHTAHFLMVSVKGEFTPNQLVDVIPTENSPDGLVAEEAIHAFADC